MTQEGPAERVDVSTENIGKIEQSVAAPSFDTVERIAAALELPPLALFGAGEEVMPKGECGRLLGRVNAKLSGMNEDQMARAAKMLEAFMGGEGVQIY
jgi:transcriptional regulator with XRE-family HTH domain